MATRAHWDDATQKTLEAIAPLLKMRPEQICQFTIIVADHDDDHTPVTLSTVPRENLGAYLMLLGYRVSDATEGDSINLMDLLN